MSGNLLVTYRDDVQVRGGLITHQWRHGLCGCFDNCGICIMAYCFPCVPFGQTAEARGNSCCCWGCLYMIPFVNLCAAVAQRGDLRTIRGIPGSCLGDCCCNIFCPFCVLVQERQESEHIQNDLLQILADRNQGSQVQVVIQQVSGGHTPPSGGFAAPVYNTPPGVGYASPVPGYQAPSMHPPAAGFPPQAAKYGVSQGYDQPEAKPAPAYEEPTKQTIRVEEEEEEE